MDSLAQTSTAGSGRKSEERQLVLFGGQHRLARAESQRQSEEDDPDLLVAFAGLRREFEAMKKRFGQQGQSCEVKDLQKMVEELGQHVTLQDQRITAQQECIEAQDQRITAQQERIEAQDQRIKVLEETCVRQEQQREELRNQLEQKIQELRNEGSEKLATLQSTLVDEFKARGTELRGEAKLALENQICSQTVLRSGTSWDLTKEDFSNYTKGQRLESPDLFLAGLKLRLGYYPKGSAAAAAGQSSLFLYAPAGVALRFRLRLDEDSYTHEWHNFSDSGRGFHFGPASGAVSSASVELLGVRHTVAQGITQSWLSPALSSPPKAA